MLGSSRPAAASHRFLPYPLGTELSYSLSQQRSPILSSHFKPCQSSPHSCKFGLRNRALHRPSPTILGLNHAFHQNVLGVGYSQKVKMEMTKLPLVAFHILTFLLFYSCLPSYFHACSCNLKYIRQRDELWSLGRPQEEPESTLLCNFG